MAELWLVIAVDLKSLELILEVLFLNSFAFSRVVEVTHRVRKLILEVGVVENVSDRLL